jgi:hypothetical protein
MRTAGGFGIRFDSLLLVDTRGTRKVIFGCGHEPASEARRVSVRALQDAFGRRVFVGGQHLGVLLLDEIDSDEEQQEQPDENPKQDVADSRTRDRRSRPRGAFAGPSDQLEAGVDAQETSARIAL